ncbi:MAG: hypothetical protein KC474_07170, partial [Cyanobacteria bacterium HKST-UBA04]|nr:hypothetical protein [Cyanobacteria bacterium HKST-UBA04]
MRLHSLPSFGAVLTVTKGGQPVKWNGDFDQPGIIADITAATRNYLGDPPAQDTVEIRLLGNRFANPVFAFTAPTTYKGQLTLANGQDALNFMGHLFSILAHKAPDTRPDEKTQKATLAAIAGEFRRFHTMGLGGVPQYFMTPIRQALALDSTAVITATALAFD